MRRGPKLKVHRLESYPSWNMLLHIGDQPTNQPTNQREAYVTVMQWWSVSVSAVPRKKSPNVYVSTLAMGQFIEDTFFLDVTDAFSPNNKPSKLWPLCGRKIKIFQCVMYFNPQSSRESRKAPCDSYLYLPFHVDNRKAAEIMPFLRTLAYH